MQINKKSLLYELQQVLKECSEKVRSFREMSPEQLNYRATENSWTALECIEHLNLYGDFYIPEVERCILAQEQDKTPDYKPGWLGNYFAGLMKVKEGSVKKMATPKDKNPIHSELSVTVLDRFLKQQDRWLSLLTLASTVHLGRTKTAVSLTRLLKLKLGDTLRFNIYHIERHVLQAQKAIAAARIAAGA